MSISGISSSGHVHPPIDSRSSAGKEQGLAREEALTEAEQREVAELEARDREVRAHEAAHVAAGGGLVTSGATYSFRTGPDGERYAVGGEVRIDTSEGSTPEETADKARQIAAAALAPADPSSQDRQVAAKARAMEAEARAEIVALRAEEAQRGSEQEDPATPVHDLSRAYGNSAPSGRSVDVYA
ncbi:hypothetical protein GPA19_22380 [Azoarcus indigens]|uniref:SprA family protein n=1 Tax=Azoarcus indigens TaxID=29545 RepID=A0A4R6DKW0_9RHOO|nr:putative metalloprotease CJM1_0395 family protein [Azoarcus indigens]NMG67693.1 hypothetical protein [Azoarcus indigens]TDN45506.1 SprA family protein [Azoarcus indigens]